MEKYKAGDLYDSSSFICESTEIVVGDDVYNRIINKSYVPNDFIKLEDLSYLKFLHYDYEGKVRVGELIVNKRISDVVLSMLARLFEARYQVKSFKLVDDYFESDSDDRNEVDTRSIADNNSYAFFYRKIYGTDRLSNHSSGYAIDINPIENPYLPFRNGEYDYSNLSEEEKKYLEHRDDGRRHVIVHSDLAYQLFDESGFEWGGDWEKTKDYQHFEVDHERFKHTL